MHNIASFFVDFHTEFTKFVTYFSQHIVENIYSSLMNEKVYFR